MERSTKKAKSSRVGKKHSSRAKAYMKQAGFSFQNPNLVNPQNYFPATSNYYRRQKESGYVDLGSAASPQTMNFSTTGTIVLCPAQIARGSGIQQRVGNKILAKSLQIRGVATNNTSAGVNLCSLIVVWDKKPAGSLPGITEVLIAANSLSQNLDTAAKRFRILKRLDFTLEGTSAAPTGKTSIPIDFYLDLKGRQVTFKEVASPNDGLIGDYEEGAMYLVSVGNVATGGAADANLVMSARYRFIDV